MKYSYDGEEIEYLPPWDEKPMNREETEVLFARLAVALVAVTLRAGERALVEDEMDVLKFAVEVLSPPWLRAMP